MVRVQNTYFNDVLRKSQNFSFTDQLNEFSSVLSTFSLNSIVPCISKSRVLFSMTFSTAN